jgi:acyl-[acyl carrier protein]--UDP-N-acetylglucosamine O-acyltransferase
MVAAAARIGDTDWRLKRIHSTASVSRLAVIGAPGEWRDRTSSHPAMVGEGCVVREFVRVHAGCVRATVIGAGTLLMAGSHVGHDAVLGERCEVAPNAVIGGCVTLGDDVKVGMGAMILPHVVVGEGARIGAGAVVKKNVPPGETWAGVPAKRIGPWRDA